MTAHAKAKAALAKRGRKREPLRLEKDFVIHLWLSESEPESRSASGRVYLGKFEVPRFRSLSQAARGLAEYWATMNGYNESWTSIRVRYGKLKLARSKPDAVRATL